MRAVTHEGPVIFFAGGGGKGKFGSVALKFSNFPPPQALYSHNDPTSLAVNLHTLLATTDPPPYPLKPPSPPFEIKNCPTPSGDVKLYLASLQMFTRGTCGLPNFVHIIMN